MPFLHLYHSRNLELNSSEYETLFKKIYQMLSANLGGIRSFNASVNVAHYSFVIENDQQHDSFIFLRIALLKKADRTQEVKDKLGKEVLAILEETFAEQLSQAKIKIHPSVEIADVTALYKN